MDMAIDQILPNKSGGDRKAHHTQGSNQKNIRQGRVFVHMSVVGIEVVPVRFKFFEPFQGNDPNNSTDHDTTQVKESMTKGKFFVK